MVAVVRIIFATAQDHQYYRDTVPFSEEYFTVGEKNPHFEMNFTDAFKCLVLLFLLSSLSYTNIPKYY